METATDCCAERGPAILSVEAARARILDAVQPVIGQERLDLRQALGRVLAQTVLSPIDVPGHANSAMDGYALNSADLSAEGARLRVIGASWAGRPFQGQAGRGECVRIMTGAKLPAGCDTVVMQEHVRVEEGYIELPPPPPPEPVEGGGGGKNLKPGENVRQAGEDLARGQIALSAGKRLGPAELGLLASLGLGEIQAQRRVRVVFFSTGDELRSIGEPLGEGQIYDSNRYVLYGLLRNLGMELLDMGQVPDDPARLRQAFVEAAGLGDAVITSGGVSVGEADFVKDMLAELGRVDFWKIAMKPGKPLAFGKLGPAWFFGLPGNPVSAMVTFLQFVRPALRRLAGETVLPPLRFPALCRTAFRKKPGRMEFQRGILELENGLWTVRSTGNQSSAALSSMSLANCLVLLPAESGGYREGETAVVEPFCD